MSNTAGVSQLAFFFYIHTELWSLLLCDPDCWDIYYFTIPKTSRTFPSKYEMHLLRSFVPRQLNQVPSLFFTCPCRLLTWCCMGCEQLAATSTALCARTACPPSCPPTADFLFPVLPICSSSIPKSICFLYYQHF